MCIRDSFWSTINNIDLVSKDPSFYKITMVSDRGMKCLWGRKISYLLFAEFLSILEWMAGSADTTIVKICLLYTSRPIILFAEAQL